MRLAPALLWSLLCAGIAACDRTDMPVDAGVSLELARHRAETISALSYDLRIAVPDDPARPLAGTVAIAFDLASADHPLQVDFQAGASSVSSVRGKSGPVSYRIENEHIVVPVGELRVGSNTLSIDFESPQDAVNRNPDFLYTLFVPDRARRAFPLFDQPDLKARYRLTLETPDGWVAMGNAELTGERTLDGRREYRFAATDPIPSYLFSFVAGKFEVVTREAGGRRLRMLHRETDAEKVARNVDAVFRLHVEALDWLENYTDIDYPFQKFAFALIPDFPYGGMEHVGAIQYRASSLLLEDAPTASQLLGRAQLIAHETAHMWFGNLVTMRWFDDVWTKEVFANFMADKIVNPQFPEIDHDLNFLVSHYPAAHGVDRTAGANAIRQQLDNLNLAGQMYGPIIYHKAPIMMRQLELLLGEEALRAGLQEYLRRFAFGNATWPELIAILDGRTPVDLPRWSEVWVHTAGMPVFAAVAGRAASSGERQARLEQRDPAGSGRLWPQDFSVWSVHSAAAAGVRFRREPSATLPASLQDTPVEGLLFNADGLGYGQFPAAPGLFDEWERLTPLQRGVLLLNSFEDLISPPFGDPRAHLQALLGVLAVEPNPLLIDLAGAQLQYVYFSLLGPGERKLFAPTLESALWETVVAHGSASTVRQFFKLLAQVALSDETLARLHDVWSGDLQVESLVLEEPEQVELAELLAVRMPARADAIVQAQVAQTANPDRQRRLAFIAPALSADAAERDRFFASLADPSRRGTEVWVTAALARLHDPTRIAAAEKYVATALALLEEIQVTGDIFFPSAWLNGTLGRHSSPAAARVVREFLAAREDLNPQLRMKVLQAADPLFRASALRAEQAAR